LGNDVAATMCLCFYERYKQGL